MQPTCFWLRVSRLVLTAASRWPCRKTVAGVVKCTRGHPQATCHIMQHQPRCALLHGSAQDVDHVRVGGLCAGSFSKHRCRVRFPCTTSFTPSYHPTDASRNAGLSLMLQIHAHKRSMPAKARDSIQLEWFWTSVRPLFGHMMCKTGSTPSAAHPGPNRNSCISQYLAAVWSPRSSGSHRVCVCQRSPWPYLRAPPCLAYATEHSPARACPVHLLLRHIQLLHRSLRTQTRLLQAQRASQPACQCTAVKVNASVRCRRRSRNAAGFL